jgi:hypothetical protein
MEKMTVLDTINSVSRAWSSVNLVRSRRELLPDLEDDDFQGFPNEKISTSKIVDMVCAMRNFENTDEDNVEELLQSDACEVSSKTLPMLPQNRRVKKRVGRMRVKFVLL